VLLGIYVGALHFGFVLRRTQPASTNRALGPVGSPDEDSELRIAWCPADQDRFLLVLFRKRRGLFSFHFVQWQSLVYLGFVQVFAPI